MNSTNNIVPQYNGFCAFFNSDIDKEIIVRLAESPISIFCVSKVNRYFYWVMNNDKLFCALFNSQYPDLVKFKDIFFKNLSEMHNDKYWKIAYFNFFKPSLQCLPLCLYKEKISIICVDENPECVAWENKKEDCEKNLRDICGSFYADPDSVIDQVWKAYQEQLAISGVDPYTQELLRRYSTLESHRKYYVEKIEKFSEQIYFLKNEKTFFMNHLSEVLILNCDGKFLQNFSEAKTLPENAAYLQFQGSKCKIELTQFHSNYFLPLISERNLAMGVQGYTMLIQKLDECITWIDEIEEGAEGTAPSVLRVCDKINSFSCPLKTYIWGTLYNQCANGTIQDRWAELHFHEFLPNLKLIVVEYRNQQFKFVTDFCKKFFPDVEEFNINGIQIHIK